MTIFVLHFPFYQNCVKTIKPRELERPELKAWLTDWNSVPLKAELEIVLLKNLSF